MGYVGNPSTNLFTSMDKQDITGNGGTSYTLSHAVANANEIEVYVNNVRQEPNVAYTTNGTALNMTGNVTSSDDFYVVFQGKAVGTIVTPDGSVGTAKLASGAVTSAKLAATIAPTNLETTASTFKMTDLSSNAFYRTGTFTPAYSSTSASDINASIFTAYTHQVGFYTRIGDIVHAQVSIKLPASRTYTNGGGSGQGIQVIGLPFNVANNANQHSGISCGEFSEWTGWAGSYTPMGYALINTKRIRLTYAHADGITENLTTYINNANSLLAFSITYPTDEA